MIPTRQILTALLLLAWIFAGAHLALEHGGELLGSRAHAAEHFDAHHGNAPGPGDTGHHHDIGAVTTAPFAKSSGQKLLIPQWLPIYDRLLAEIAAALRGGDEPRVHSVVCDAPLDTRDSGWLFLVQTALPVRGPSLGV